MNALDTVTILGLKHCYFPLVLVLHHLTEHIERLFNWLSTFGTALHVGNMVLLSKLFGFLGWDFSLSLQIHFIAHKHNLRGFWGSLRQILNPISYNNPKITHRVERLLGINTKHNKRAITVLIIILRYRLILILARRIPNLQFDALVLQVERFKAEVHSNGRHVVLTELVVGES